LCAVSPPVLLIVRARGSAYIFGSLPVLSAVVAVSVLFAIINPILSPVAFDEWLWLGISDVVNICVSSPFFCPKLLDVKPEPLPVPTTTRPCISGTLKLVSLPP